MTLADVPGIVIYSPVQRRVSCSSTSQSDPRCVLPPQSSLGSSTSSPYSASSSNAGTPGPPPCRDDVGGATTEIGNRRFDLYIADLLLCTTLFTVLNAFLWRGVWEVEALILAPTRPLKSGLSSLAIGAVVGLTCYFCIPALSRLTKTPSRRVLLVIKAFYLIRAVGVVSTWRGGWDCTLLVGRMLEAKYQIAALRIMAAVSLLVLVAVRQTNSMLAGPPFTVELDDAVMEALDRSTLFGTHKHAGICKQSDLSVWRRGGSFACHVLDVLFTVWVVDVLSSIVWLYLGVAMAMSEIEPRVDVVVMLFVATLVLHLISEPMALLLRSIQNRHARLLFAAVVNVMATCVSALYVQTLWSSLERGAQQSQRVLETEVLYFVLGAAGMLKMGVLSSVSRGGVSFDDDTPEQPIFNVSYMARGRDREKGDRMSVLSRHRKESDPQTSQALRSTRSQSLDSRAPLLAASCNRIVDLTEVHELIPKASVG